MVGHHQPKQAVTITEIRSVALTRHGADWHGRCPFHDDKTPSLVISPTKRLWHYRSKGHKVVLMGKEQVNGSDAYALKISLKGGDELISFIDAKTFLEVKAANKAVSKGKTVEVETTIGDYRPVNGVMLPFSLEIRPNGQAQGMKILLNKVEANTPMDAARFQFPAMKPRVN